MEKSDNGSRRVRKPHARMNREPVRSLPPSRGVACAILLVHGVGAARKGSMAPVLQRAAPGLLSTANVEEFVWNTIVEQPSDRDPIDDAYLQKLATAWIPAATIHMDIGA